MRLKPSEIDRTLTRFGELTTLDVRFRSLSWKEIALIVPPPLNKIAMLCDDALKNLEQAKYYAGLRLKIAVEHILRLFSDVEMIMRLTLDVVKRNIDDKEAKKQIEMEYKNIREDISKAKIDIMRDLDNPEKLILRLEPYYNFIEGTIRAVFERAILETLLLYELRFARAAAYQVGIRWSPEDYEFYEELKKLQEQSELIGSEEVVSGEEE